MGVKLIPYDPKIVVLRSTSEPAAICYAAAATTQQCAISELQTSDKSEHILQSIAKMGHTSIFEHASVTFLLENVSRGCVDQITRHRMGSFTCSSTHYEAHEDTIYLTSALDAYDRGIREACEKMHQLYMISRKSKAIGAEARQLLPLATSCRLIWTVNARALINFLRLRLCARNMHEMRMVAERVRSEASDWFPELFNSAAPYPECARTKCDQGHMSCGNPWSFEEWAL